MKIAIEIRSVYGENKAYPADGAATVFAQIAGTRTLVRRTLCQILALGYEIEVRYGGATQIIRASDAAMLPAVF